MAVVRASVLRLVATRLLMSVRHMPLGLAICLIHAATVDC